MNFDLQWSEKKTINQLFDNSLDNSCCYMGMICTCQSYTYISSRDIVFNHQQLSTLAIVFKSALAGLLHSSLSLFSLSLSLPDLSRMLIVYIDVSALAVCPKIFFFRGKSSGYESFYLALSYFDCNSISHAVLHNLHLHLNFATPTWNKKYKNEIRKYGSNMTG